jgi:hypothetical protein
MLRALALLDFRRDTSAPQRLERRLKLGARAPPPRRRIEKDDDSHCARKDAGGDSASQAQGRALRLPFVSTFFENDLAQALSKVRRAHTEDGEGIVAWIELPGGVGHALPFRLQRVANCHVHGAFLDLPLGFGI